MHTRVLIVANDVAARARLAVLLKAEGYAPELAEPAARAHLGNNRGVALAIVLPDQLGDAAHTVVRGLQAQIGCVIVLAPPGTNRLTGCAVVDVDDTYALLAAIAAQLAERDRQDRSDDEPLAALRFGELCLDVAGQTLWHDDGSEIRLTTGEFRLLRAFAERPRRVLSRAQLIRLIKHDDTATDRAIDMLLVRLRRKIEADPRAPVLIVTVPGTGYKFTALVSRLEAAEQPWMTREAPPGAVVVPPGTVAGTALGACPERRRVTILCAELLPRPGHTLPQDPELYGALLAAHRRLVAGIAEPGGAVLGPGGGSAVTAYFGLPEACEHACEAAVAVALDIADAAMGPRTWTMSEQACDRKLAVRLGVAAGTVVVAPDGGVIGEARDRAVALTAYAAPGAVVIGAEVRRAVGALFRCVAEAPAAWRVIGRGQIQNRFRALRGRLPLAGRDDEMSVLRRGWARACQSEGRVAWITGEAGIGKSRLLHAIADHCTAGGGLRLCVDCCPHQSEAAFHPLVGLLRHLTRPLGPPHQPIDRARFARRLAAAQPRDGELATLMALMEPGAPGVSAAAALDRNAALAATVLALLTRLTQAQPVLLLVEDAHWADSLSAALLSRVCGAVAGLRLMVVVSSRPDFTPDWVDAPRVTRLPLGRLDAADSMALASSAAGYMALPPGVTARIAERAQGVPLFVEELTRSVLGAPARAGGADTADYAGALEIPATLQDLLTMRLDQLGPARDVAQCAAVLGEAFTLADLAVVTGLPAPRLEAEVSRLVTAQLFLRGVGDGQVVFRFRHGLIRDTAYAALMQDRRRFLHARAATMAKDPAFDMAGRAHVLARHFTEAGMTREAAACWQRAALRSLELAAMPEAASQSERALGLLAELPENPDRKRSELAALVVHGKALMSIAGHAAPATGAAFARALALCEALDDPPEMLTVLFVLWGHAFFRVRLAEASSRATALHALALQRADEIWLVMSTYTLGFTDLLAGNTGGAIGLLRDGIARFDPARRGQYAGPTIGDPRVVMRAYLGWGLMMQGEFAEAEQSLQAAVQEARDLRQPWVLSLALTHLINVQATLRGVACAAALIDEVTQISSGIAYYAAVAEIQRGWLTASAGDVRAGLDASRRGRARQAATGALLHLPYFMRLEAAMELSLGDVEAAAETLQSAQVLHDVTGEHWDDAEFQRQRGDILFVQGTRGEALAAWQSAHALARARGQGLFVLRAAIPLAGQLRQQGQTEAADDLLAQALAGVENNAGVQDVAVAARLLNSGLMTAGLLTA